MTTLNPSIFIRTVTDIQDNNEGRDPESKGLAKKEEKGGE